ncbi:SusD/RagB family nutrient-binding outer membrane lipoprotein [Bacteroides ovatus]|nr:SusD/RagB family nutrient-binding outer membrane lipoprotein [Bacteroides ovatus]
MMNIRKFFKVRNYYLLLGVIMINVGCTKNFLEYNTNPNEATDEMTDWDNVRTGSLLLQMEQNVLVVAQPGLNIGSDRYQTVEVMGGDGYVGYFGFPAPSINSAGRYNWDKRSWYGDMFTTNYLTTMNAWREIRKAINNDEDPRFSMAQILKVAAMHRVTDTYTTIPYLNFGVSKEVPYDSQKDVYYRFFEELDGAINNLDSYAASGSKVLSSWDCVFNGDVTSWIKFANSLRLRLALHLAYVDETKAKSEAQLAIGNSYGLMNVKSDLAELQHITPIATYESPLYILKGWDDICMGATLDSYMNGYQDPRLSAYFEAGTGGKYRGIRAGMSKDVSKDKYITGIFAEPQATATSNVVWMRSSESYFLLAEYALRWGTNADAKKYYEDGIRMSFDEHGVSGADAYLTRTAAGGYVPANYEDPVTSSHSMDALGTVSIAWDESGDFKTNLEQIITQKYIALYPVGQEAWTEFRRTGYPKVFPVVVNESSGGSVDTNIQIRRLPYPESEYNTNRTELDKGITLLGGVDNPGVRLWWDVPNK